MYKTSLIYIQKGSHHKSAEAAHDDSVCHDALLPFLHPSMITVYNLTSLRAREKKSINKPRSPRHTVGRVQVVGVLKSYLPRAWCSSWQRGGCGLGMMSLGNSGEILWLFVFSELSAGDRGVVVFGAFIC